VRRSFHWKRLLLVLAVAFGLCGALFALNRVQVRKNATVIKTVAEKAKSEINGDAAKRTAAITLFARYLKFEPNDEEAFEDFAKLLLEECDAAPTADARDAAITGLENFLRTFPKHPELRRQLANLYLKAGKVPSAREHLEMMYNDPKSDEKKNIELLEKLAECEEVSGDLSKAIERLEEAIAVSQEKSTPMTVRVRLYRKTLDLLNQNKADGQRETKIANHVRTLLDDKGPFSSEIEARVVLARFELFRNELKNAGRDVARALELAGERTNADALLAAAELDKVEAKLTPGESARRIKLIAARDHLLKAHLADKKNVSVGVFLADTLDLLGERDKALEVLRSTAEALGEVNDQFLVVIDHLIDLGNQEIAAGLVDRVAARVPAQNLMQRWVTYFRGRLAVLKGDWIDAKNQLEEVAPLMARSPESHKRAMFDLSRVYDVLQNPDKQLECCRSALRDAGPIFPPALIGEADALAKLGRLDDAITKYQILVTNFQATKLRPTLVRLRLFDTLRRPPENRNWEHFDSTETLGLAEDRTDEINILHAQSLAARGEKAKAIALLEAIVKKEPKSPLATTAAVNLARIQIAGRPEASLAILTEARNQVGFTVDLRLTFADVLALRAKPPTPAEFEELGKDSEHFLKSEQHRLWFGLGQAALTAAPRLTDPDARKAMLEAAMRFLRIAAKVEPRDLLSRAVLIDLAVAADKKEVIRDTLKELEILEGPDGPIRSLAQVAVALPEIPKIANEVERKKKIGELRELTLQVQKQRPFWGRVYVALGRLDEREGLNERAVENYRKAIENGDREEVVIRRTVELYRERKQDAVAASVLDGLSTKMILPDDLERFRAIFEMLNRPVPRAELPTINRIAPGDSKDYKILLLRGSLLAAIRDDAGALRAFRDAVGIANPPVAETYEAVVGQLVRTGQVPEAKIALAEAVRNLSPDTLKTAAAKADLFVTLGRMHEMVGDSKAAVLSYQKAVETAPGELNPHRRLVEFLMRTGHSADAEQMLSSLTTHPGQDIARWARRFLSSVAYLARPNPYEQRKAALALIQINLDSGANDPEDIKAQAVIWTVDPETRDKGVQVLQEFWKKGELTPDEAYLLGRLTFDLGPSKILESEKYFESAARPRPGVSVEHLAALVRVRLALGDIQGAELKLERLKTAAPKSWEATREEARVLKRKSREALLRADRDDAKKFGDQARELILKFDGNNTPEAIRFRSGPLLEELDFPDDAAVMYRTLLAQDSPTAHLPLAVLYIRQKKSTEAIALAQEYEKKAPVLVTALIYTGAVRSSRPDAAKEKIISDWLDARITEYSGKAELGGLLGAKGELYDAQGKYKEAIEEYRRALRVGQSETVTNNLAMLLALYEAPKEPGKADEAIQMMTKLIDIRGPAPTFLDTRAVAYIIKGGDDTAKAVKDLEMALLQRVRPAYLFHLAWAYDLQGKRLDREKRLEEAVKVGLTPDDVHPLEREAYQRFLGPIPK
jgi:cellulose synthase operon protein C